MTQEIKFQEFVKEVEVFLTPSEEKVTKAIEIIRKELFTYVKEAKLNSLVIGISGGLDSACVAAIASPVCKELNIPLIGMFIPLNSSDKHKEQAFWVGETFCDSFSEISSWEEDFYKIGQTPHSLVEYAISTTDRVISKAGIDTLTINRKIQMGNVKSRLRMITLYAVANATNGMVLGTGNMSEDSILYFFTIGGDGQVDWSPIKTIGKGFELPVFAKVLEIREDIIVQEPSDGLSVTEQNTDMAQIGLDSYKEVDAIGFAMLGMLNKELQEKFNQIKEHPKVKIIETRYKKYSFKEKGEIFITRSNLFL